MIDVVGAEHRPGKLLQQVVFFVGGAVGADDADGLPPRLSRISRSFVPACSQRLLPTDFGKLAVCLAQQRLGQAVGVVGKIEGVASLDAQEVAIDAALVAVVAAQDLRAVINAAHAQGGLASVSAVGADGGDVIHLPGAGLVTIGA